MNKNIFGWLAVLVLFGLIIFFFIRDTSKPSAEPDTTPDSQAATEAPAPESQAGTLSKQAAPEVIQEDDPEGNLRLEGQVLDSGGLAVEAARVSIDASPRRTAVTEKDGSFFFDKLLGKRYRLTARHEAAVGGPVLHRLSEKSQPVIIRLRTGAVLEITVTARQTGDPVKDAWVQLRSESWQSQTTDEQGRARLVGVSSGHSTVSVKAEGFAPAQRLIQVPTTTTEPVAIQIALQGGSSASGRVLDEQGSPVEGAQVLAVDTAELINLAKAEHDGAVTDQQGQFNIQTLTAGTYRFTATHEDLPPGESKAVDIDGRSPTSGIEIVMSAGGQISGRVVTATDRPAPWVQVRVIREDGRSLSGGLVGARQKHATSDQAGEFEFKGLPRCRLKLMASGELGASEVVPVDLQAASRVDDLVLRLTVQGRIAGMVVNSQGEPVPEVQVSAIADFFAEGTTENLTLGGISTAMTDGAGNFELAGLAEGAYRLRAAHSGGSRRQWLQPGVAARTGDQDVRLVLDADGALKGRLRFNDGGAPENFSVALSIPPGIPVTSPDGSFDLPEVAPGTFDVTFRGQDFADTTVPGVEVKPEEVKDLGVVTVVRGRTVTGRVLQENGSAVPGATVLIARKLVGDGSNLAMKLGQGAEEQMGLRRAVADRDGAFRVGGVGHQRYLIIAEHDKLGRSGLEVIPEGSMSPSYDLTLHGFGSVVGTVTSGGKPVSGAVIQINTKGESDHVSAVTAGEDGSYVIKRLHAGEHRITAALVSGGGTGATSTGKMVMVEANQQIRVDFDIPVGNVTLTVNVQGVDGAKIDAAQVLLLAGQVAISNVDELKTKATSTGGGILQGFWLPVRPAQFNKVTPGEHTLCIIPINGNMSDPAFLQRLQKNTSHLAVHCSPKAIPTSPEQQTHSAVVPPMPPLPEESAPPAE